MRTHTAIAMLAEIAVATEKLKGLWKIIIDDPSEQDVTYANFLAMFGTIVVNVIYRQKDWFRFATTRTFIAIMIEDDLLELSIMTPSDICLIFRVVLILFAIISFQTLRMACSICFLIFCSRFAPTLSTNRTTIGFTAIAFLIAG